MLLVHTPKSPGHGCRCLWLLATRSLWDCASCWHVPQIQRPVSSIELRKATVGAARGAEPDAYRLCSPYVSASPSPANLRNALYQEVAFPSEAVYPIRSGRYVETAIAL